MNDETRGLRQRRKGTKRWVGRDSGGGGGERGGHARRGEAALIAACCCDSRSSRRGGGSRSGSGGCSGGGSSSSSSSSGGGGGGGRGWKRQRSVRSSREDLLGWRGLGAGCGMRGGLSGRNRLRRLLLLLHLRRLHLTVGWRGDGRFCRLRLRRAPRFTDGGAGVAGLRFGLGLLRRLLARLGSRNGRLGR
jgi:hypothetical protein